MDRRSISDQPQGARRAPSRVWVLLGAAVLVAACGSGGAAPTPAEPSTGADVRITARNLQFEPAELSAPAGTPIRLTLDNQDGGTPHDVRVAADGQVLVTSSIVNGPAQTEVRLGPLEAGRYALTCTIHPSMKATLEVRAP